LEVEERKEGRRERDEKHRPTLSRFSATKGQNALCQLSTLADERRKEVKEGGREIMQSVRRARRRRRRRRREGSRRSTTLYSY